jgi:hypothetical protein
MQLLKDLWAVVQALLAVVKTLISYVRLAVQGVENFIGKLTHKKAVEAAPVEAAPVEAAPAPTDVPPVA